MRALTNDQWGLDSNCFVCEQTNPAGLQLPFFHEEDDERVVADFELGDQFSGAPAYVHGGVLLAILDEAMAWAAIAVAHEWAVTGETTTRFEHPVLVGHRYRVEAWLGDRPGESAQLPASAFIADDAGRRCATASATLVALGEAQAIEAAGRQPPDLDPSHPRAP